MQIESLKTKIQKLKAKKTVLEEDIQGFRKTKKKVTLRLTRKQEALALVNDTALKTQEQLEFHLGDMVTPGS